MDKVNGIDMHFNYKKRGHSPDTFRLWAERKRLLKPEKTRIVGRGTENEKIQEYQPSQQFRKRIVELNIQMYNRFFSYCETLGTAPLEEFQQINDESWIVLNSSDTESQTSYVRQEPYKRHQKVPQTRQSDPVETNRQNKHPGWRTQWADWRDNQKSREGFCTRPTYASRRNSARCENSKRYYCHSKKSNRRNFLLLPAT